MTVPLETVSPVLHNTPQLPAAEVALRIYDVLNAHAPLDVEPALLASTRILAAEHREWAIGQFVDSNRVMEVRTTYSHDQRQVVGRAVLGFSLAAKDWEKPAAEALLRLYPPPAESTQTAVPDRPTPPVRTAASAPAGDYLLAA